MVALRKGGPLKDFLRRVLDHVLHVFSGGEAYLLFVQADTVSLEAARTARQPAIDDPESAICLKLIERVLASRRPLLLADPADDKTASDELSSQGIPCSSLAIVSFPIEADRQGVLYLLDGRLPKGGDQGVLWALMPFLNLASLAYHQLSPEALPSP
jgi:hypothetical protein